MAIPYVNLTTHDDLTIRFCYHPSLFFTACIWSKDSQTALVTVSSNSASVFRSSSSRFEVYFDNSFFDFPHSEFKKFKTFLDEVKTLKEAA